MAIYRLANVEMEPGEVEGNTAIRIDIVYQKDARYAPVVIQTIPFTERAATKDQLIKAVLGVANTYIEGQKKQDSIRAAAVAELEGYELKGFEDVELPEIEAELIKETAKE